MSCRTKVGLKLFENREIFLPSVCGFVYLRVGLFGLNNSIMNLYSKSTETFCIILHYLLEVKKQYIDFNQVFKHITFFLSNLSLKPANN